MRSVILHFVGASRDDIAESLREFGAREQEGAPWIYPPDGDPVLYIHWYADCEEVTALERRALEQQLGTRPDVSLIVDVTGRVPGQPEVRSLIRHLLKAHRGAAQDDYSSHVWTPADIEADAVIAGRRFFHG